MKPMINYARHYIDNHDLKSVEEVLKSDFLSQGPATFKFEKLLFCIFIKVSSLAKYN